MILLTRSSRIWSSDPTARSRVLQLVSIARGDDTALFDACLGSGTIRSGSSLRSFERPRYLHTPRYMRYRANSVEENMNFMNRTKSSLWGCSFPVSFEDRAKVHCPRWRFDSRWWATFYISSPSGFARLVCAREAFLLIFCWGRGDFGVCVDDRSWRCMIGTPFNNLLVVA